MEQVCKFLTVLDLHAVKVLLGDHHQFGRLLAVGAHGEAAFKFRVILESEDLVNVIVIIFFAQFASMRAVIGF